MACFDNIVLVVAQSVGVLIYSIRVSQDTSQEAIIILILNITDSFTVEGLERFNVRPGPIVGLNGHRLIDRLSTKSNRQPLPTDKKLAT